MIIILVTQSLEYPDSPVSPPLADLWWPAPANWVSIVSHKIQNGLRLFAVFTFQSSTWFRWFLLSIQEKLQCLVSVFRTASRLFYYLWFLWFRKFYWFLFATTPSSRINTHLKITSCGLFLTYRETLPFSPAQAWPQYTLIPHIGGWDGYPPYICLLVWYSFNVSKGSSGPCVSNGSICPTVMFPMSPVILGVNNGSSSPNVSTE